MLWWQKKAGTQGKGVKPSSQEGKRGEANFMEDMEN